VKRRDWLRGALALAAKAARAQEEFVCPMDPDVRSATATRCPRCGMRLVAVSLTPVEYRVAVRMVPAAPRPGDRVRLELTVEDPRTGRRVREFEEVHERLHHLFLVSQDLEFFAHAHPSLDRDGVFRLDVTLPRPGLYRLLSDFYPRHGTPQLVENTVIVGGPSADAPRWESATTPKRAENLEVSLTTEPARPIAGSRTRLQFRVEPAAGLEPYLGAWGHLLVASEDLVDLIHSHPFLANGGPQLQFNVILPRPSRYRIWAQFQRSGVVNTARFDVEAVALG
jgi:hypothetical protein